MVSSSCVPQKDDPEWVKEMGFRRFQAFPEMLVYSETDAEYRTVSRLLYHFSSKYPNLVVALRKGKEIFIGTRRKDVELPSVFSGAVGKLRSTIGEQISERMEVEGWSDELLRAYYDSQFIESRVNVRYARARMAKYNLGRPEMRYVRKKLREARGVGNRKLTDYF